VAETDPTDPLGAFAREARLEQAAESRRRRAHWDRLSVEEATLATILERLARDGRSVRVHGIAGSPLGSVAELGPDHVRLVVRDRWCALRYSAIDWVEAGGPEEGGAGGAERVERSFDQRLSRLAGEDVVLVMASGAVLVGRLEAAGVDVLTVVPDGGTGPVYASSSAVVAVRAGEGSG
jgi:hypothetical protein